MKSNKRIIWIALLLVTLLASAAVAERMTVGAIQGQKVDNAIQTMTIRAERLGSISR